MKIDANLARTSVALHDHFEELQRQTAKLESIAVKQPLLTDKKTFELVKERVMAKKQITAIPDLGEVETYGILRLSRLSERGRFEEPPDLETS